MGYTRAVLKSVLLFTVATTAAFAQTTFATITGTVTDPNETVVPNTTVEAIHLQSNYRYTASSNQAGDTCPPGRPNTHSIGLGIRTHGPLSLLFRTRAVSSIARSARPRPIRHFRAFRTDPLRRGPLASRLPAPVGSFSLVSGPEL